MNRIFVIDDEAAMGENIQRMLKFPDTTVTAYADPVKGLADALAKPPDLVLAGYADARDVGRGGLRAAARGASRPAHRFSHRVRIGGGRGGGHAQRRIRLPAETVQAGRSPAGGEAGALARRVGAGGRPAERKVGGARRKRPSPEPQRRHAGIDRKGPAGRRHRCHRHDSG